MTKLKVNMFPKDGHFYKEADGYIHRAGSWKRVIAMTQDYRRRNGLPMGDPEADVIAQACQRNPALCYEEYPHQREQRKKASVKGRVLAWLNRILARPERKYVSPEEAQSRASICAGCPKNTKIAEGCSSCRAAIKEYRNKLVGNRPGDARIEACSELGEDLVVSTWLDEVRVEAPEAPANCWRKRQ